MAKLPAQLKDGRFFPRLAALAAQRSPKGESFVIAVNRASNDVSSATLGGSGESDTRVGSA
jgi:hypothetical protein